MIKNKSFNFLLTGRFLSNIGDSIYNILLSWYILQITNNSIWIGILQAAIYIPNIISFAFGNIIDNTSKKKLLVYLSLGQCISTSLMCIVLFAQFNQPLLLCILTFFASLFGMNIYTVQDAYIPKIVKKEELEKAQTEMSISYKIADYLFNGICGFLMERIKYIYLMISSAITFLLSAFFFTKIEDVDEIIKNENSSNDAKQSIFAGFKFILRNKTILIFTIFGTMANFLFAGFNIYIVLIANEMNSAFMLGVMNSAISIGAFLGSLVLSGIILKNVPIGKKLTINKMLFGLAIIVCSLFSGKWYLAIFLGIAGIFLGVTHVTETPIMQTIIPKEDIGKVMSSQYSITVGIMPLGSLFFGAVSKHLNSSLFLILFGLYYVIIFIFYYTCKPIWNATLKD